MLKIRGSDRRSVPGSEWKRDQGLVLAARALPSSIMAMRVFVTGATGVIGRRAVPLLVGAGHQVTAVGRSRERLALLADRGASVVALDLFDQDAVGRAVRGHDAIVNLATHIPKPVYRQFLRSSWKEMDRIRREASAILVDAALAAKVGRFVQESFAPIYPDRGEQWIAEDTPLEPVRYNRSVLDAEVSVDRFNRSGGAGVVLRFAFFYGPNDSFTKEVLKSVRRGWLPLLGPPEAFFSMVHHADAATAVVAALGAAPGRYNVVDSNPLTHRQLGDMVAQLLHVRPPRLPPTWIVPLTGGLGRMMARSIRMSNAKLSSATGWAPSYSTAADGWSTLI
jgi:nucleoside-diphosphate-sugar epimerase